jgi:hypothetical protein
MLSHHLPGAMIGARFTETIGELLPGATVQWSLYRNLEVRRESARYRRRAGSANAADLRSFLGIRCRFAGFQTGRSENLQMTQNNFDGAVADL